MKLNEAVSKRLLELLDERKMTQYQLYMKSGVPKSTIGNVINCSYDSVKLRIIHEMCQGMGIGIRKPFLWRMTNAPASCAFSLTVLAALPVFWAALAVFPAV